MKPTEEQIAEIADNKKSDLHSYFNIKTGELLSMPEYDKEYFEEDESWAHCYREVNENPDDYYEFRASSSNNSFQIMAEFAEAVNDKVMQGKLMQALDRPKPFKNFRMLIDNSGEYRELWFDFERKYMINAVAEQIEENEVGFKV